MLGMKRPREDESLEEMREGDSCHDEGIVTKNPDSEEVTDGAKEPGATVAEVAAAEAYAEASAFSSVRKNRAACISHLVKLAQRIERVWDVDEGLLRRALLGTFRDSLLSLRDHKDKDCVILAGLGEKMKDLDMDLRHFLTMALPVERQHTRGLRDDEFLITRTEDVPSCVSTVSMPASSAASTGKKRIPLVFVVDNMRSAFNV